MMDVYIRKPNQLDSTAFGAFADERIVISPKKPQTNNSDLKEKYNELGDSFLPLDNGEETADDMESIEARSKMPSRKLQIPTQFLEEKKGNENVSVSVTNRSFMTTETELRRGTDSGEMMRNFGKEEMEVSTGKQEVILNGVIERKSPEDMNQERNRPSSKLIQDNENLQQLFNSVRGDNEPDNKATNKNIGKLRMPNAFSARKEAGICMQGMERQGNGKELTQRTKEDIAGNVMGAQMGVKDQGRITDAPAMSFDDWKQEKDSGPDGSVRKDETVEFQRNRVGSFNILNEHNDGNGAGSKTYPKRYGNHNANAIDSNEPQVHGGAKNYWLSKQNEEENWGKANAKQNKQPVNGNYSEQVYPATRNLVQFNPNDSIDSSMNKIHQVESTENKGAGRVSDTEDNLTDKGASEKIEATMGIDEELAELRKARRNRPSIDEVNNGSDEGQAKNMKSVGKLKLPTAFGNSQSSKKTDNSGNVASQRPKKKAFGNDARFQNGGHTHDNVKVEPIGTSETIDAAKEQRDSRIVNSNKGRFSRDASFQDGGIKPIGGKQGIDSDSFVSGGGSIEENRSDVESQGVRKPVGKLNMNAFFQQENNQKKEEKKEESSVAKNKAMFDQKNKETQKKGKGVGKLRVGSAKSDRYVELDNITPEGELPSNISTDMKDQLEKILQGRPGSVSSQTSSSSRKSEGKEFGRLSISSMSSLNTSLNSPRTAGEGDFSARSISLEEEVFKEEQQESEEDSWKKKVNNGNLKFQLDNIFQNRASGGSSSVSSSVSNSLDTSMNASESEEVKSEFRKSIASEDGEKAERRMLIANAIKEKYGGKANKDEDSAKLGREGVVANNKNDAEENMKIPKNAINEQLNGVQSNDEGFKTSGTEAQARPNKLNLKEFTPNETASQNVEVNKAPRSGKVSIPSIFGSNPNQNSNQRTTNNGPVMRKKNSMVDKFEKSRDPPEPITGNNVTTSGSKAAVGKLPNDRPSEAITVDSEVPKRGPSQARKLNIPSTFLGGQQPTGNGPKNVSATRNATASSNKITLKQETSTNHVEVGRNAEVSDQSVLDGAVAARSIENVETSSSKKVQFEEHVGVIGKIPIDENTDGVQNTRPKSGKLSSSFMLAFENKEETPNSVRNRPATPGANGPKQNKNFFKNGWDKQNENPVIEEEERSVPAQTKPDILKLDGGEQTSMKADYESKDNNMNLQSYDENMASKMKNVEKETSLTQEKENTAETVPKKKVGKLSIPSMFK
eukprot:Seg2368.2 transcript_id=Seg2368.2/GoldUCD/mRNA.D3Y31 product="hypothetical protein" protein_id=Seg2368.2/GoldUCD/D3Y31